MLKHSISNLTLLAAISEFSFLVPVQQVFAGIISFPGAIKVNDPCSSEPLMVTVRGETTLSINETPYGVFVYMHFSGLENGYSANFYGNKRFNRKQNSYKVKINGEFAGTTVFTSRGVDAVLTRGDKLTPSGDQIQSLDNTCKLP